METKSIATFSITHPVTDPTTRLIEEAPQEDTADKKEESSIPIVAASAISAAAGATAGAGIGSILGMAGTFTDNAPTPIADTDDMPATPYEDTPPVVVPEPYEAVPDTDIAYIEPTPVVQPAEAIPTTDTPDDFVTAEMVDPTDVNAADMLFEVMDINNVYTVDGEAMLTASVIDNEGNELVMVDVDNDQILDIVTDTDGNLLSVINGGVNVSDLEMTLIDETGYIAQDAQDAADLNLPFENDIIDPTTLA